MLRTPSLPRSFGLGAHPLHRPKAVHSWASPQPSKWQKRVWWSSWHLGHRRTPPKSAVGHGICARGKTSMLFIDLGVRINEEVYRWDIFEVVVVFWPWLYFSRKHWTFQQDYMSVYRVRSTQEWCRTHFLDWPPYSLDLNPIHYNIWSTLVLRACTESHRSLVELKASLRWE